MSYITGQLKAAMSDYRRAQQTLRLAEVRRDDLIRRAHREGGLSTRDIGAIVELPFQRVAEKVASDQDATKRPTLHGAMQIVVDEHPDGDWMAVHDIAREIYRRELYRRKDRGVIPPGQIRARAAKYPDLFEGSQDGSNRIRLREPA